MTGNCQVLKSSGSFKECSFIFLSTLRFYSIYNYIFIYLILTLEREMASNPFQYSCLENPMDRGAWQAAVHGVSKSWLQLKWLSMHARNTDMLSCIANKLISVWLSASPTRFTEMRECLLWLLYPPQGCDVEENIYILKAQYKLKPTTLNSKYSQILALCESSDFLRGNKLRHLLPSTMGDIKELRWPFSQGQEGERNPIKRNLSLRYWQTDIMHTLLVTLGLTWNLWRLRKKRLLAIGLQYQSSGIMNIFSYMVFVRIKGAKLALQSIWHAKHYVSAWKTAESLPRLLFTPTPTSSWAVCHVHWLSALTFFSLIISYIFRGSSPQVYLISKCISSIANVSFAFYIDFVVFVILLFFPNVETC